MKRVLFIILISIILPQIAVDKVFAAYNADLPENQQVQDEPDPVLPNIFIWQLPDSSIIPEENIADENSEEEKEAEEPQQSEEELYLSNYDNVQYKGYLEFLEATDAISLKQEDKEFALNLSVPQKFESSKLVNAKDIKLPTTSFAHNVLARSTSDLQYNIAPLDHSSEISKGGFSVGTAYNESIDNADLGFTTSFYTKYETKYFALKTAYEKNAGVAYSLVVDQFSVAPELKLNEYISIKDVLTSDITRDRKKNELVLSIKPTKEDRLRFEFGAGQTFDANSELIKSQVKFSTQFKW